tara:strand:- start:61 stop:675 length:615 start_codon:yes stop_codon:yes gene_type:complete
MENKAISKMNKKELYELCKGLKHRLKNTQVIAELSENNYLETNEKLNSVFNTANFPLIKENEELLKEKDKYILYCCETNNRLRRSNCLNEKLKEENKKLKDKDWDKKYSLKIDYEELLEENKTLKEMVNKMKNKFVEPLMRDNEELKKQLEVRKNQAQNQVNYIITLKEDIIELKKQFNNIINLIKTADTDEKIKMLKELDTLD